MSILVFQELVFILAKFHASCYASVLEMYWSWSGSLVNITPDMLTNKFIGLCR